MSQLILVVGGTGMLGEPVVRCLLADGVRVRVMTRSPEKARAQFERDVELVEGDVEDVGSLEAALEGCQGVHVNLRSSADTDLERRGAANVAQAAARAGVGRISYLSGATVCAGNCWFVGTKAKFEAETAIRDSGVPYFIFRATWFMESLNSLLRVMGGTKRALQIGRQPHPYRWVAADDYARMVSTAYRLAEAESRTFYVCGPSAYTMREALEIFCRIAHPDAAFTYLPLWAASLIARIGGREELQAAIPFLRYMEQVREGGDPGETNALLGAPTTTLEQWSAARRVM
jgi:uncharacterized protein YbjT (DUF2867 family)